MKQLRRLCVLTILILTLAVPTLAIRRPSNDMCSEGQVCEQSPPCDPTSGKCSEEPPVKPNGTVLADGLDEAFDFIADIWEMLMAN